MSAPVAFRLAFVACSLATLGVLWAPRYLPMIDLPQHAAQVAIWQHYDDPAWGFADQFEFNWFTPYLFGYVVVRVFAGALGTLVAMKLVVSAALLGAAAALARLLERAGSDRWWALAGFPLGFGFCFYWGFFNFLVAVPVGLFYLEVAMRAADHPSRKNDLQLASLGVLLHFCHVLVLGVVGLAAALYTLAGQRTVRAAARRAVPLLVPIPLAVAWAALTYQRDAAVRAGAAWGLELDRLYELPNYILGIGPDTDAALAAVLLAAFPLYAGARVAHDWRRLLPFAGALALYFFFPQQVFGTAYVSQRFAGFLLPFGFLALGHVPESPRARLGRGLFLAVCLTWLALLGARFLAFDEDARSFDEIAAKMAPNRRVLSLVFDYGRDSSLGAVFLHFPAWYQAQKGGVLGFSFARYFPQLARYRPGKEPMMTPRLEWSPASFDWSRDGDYDYFVVRAREDRGPQLLEARPARLVLRKGNWWLYERIPTEVSP